MEANKTLTDNLVKLGLIDEDNFHDCEEMEEACVRCIQYDNCLKASPDIFDLLTTKTINE